MNETTKIRDIALPYCEGRGIDLGCGDEKIKEDAIGIDSGLDAKHGKGADWRDLSCVDIQEVVTDLSMFEDGELDYVYTSHFLEHLIEPEKMIKDVVRVLKSGGNFVVYLPDRILYTEPNPDHHNMWTCDEFVKILPEEFNIVHRIDKHSDYGFFVVARKKHD